MQIGQTVRRNGTKNDYEIVKVFPSRVLGRDAVPMLKLVADLGAGCTITAFARADEVTVIEKPAPKKRRWL